jgi:hypothetical protein
MRDTTTTTGIFACTMNRFFLLFLAGKKMGI